MLYHYQYDVRLLEERPVVGADHFKYCVVFRYTTVIPCNE